MGETGMVMVLDANTGKHRTTVNIEKAANHRTVEAANAPRFRKLACAERPPAGEDDLVLLAMPGDDDKAAA